MGWKDGYRRPVTKHCRDAKAGRSVGNCSVPQFTDPEATGSTGGWRSVRVSVQMTDTGAAHSANGILLGPLRLS